MADTSTQTPNPPKQKKAKKPLKIKARAPRGFVDKTAPTVRAEQGLIQAVTAIYGQHGFEPLETSAFEYADALGKFLPDDDRPNAGVFALQDDDEQWMALRYDHTAPLARYAAENWQHLAKPYRRYAAGPVWRNEKPGPGRFREFWQCDADIVGSDNPAADAEICLIARKGLTAAGLSDEQVSIKINNRKLLNATLDMAEVSDPTQKLIVLRALDKLDRLGLEGVTALLGDGRKDESGDFTTGAKLTPKQIETVLAFSTAGRETRADTLTALEGVVGGHAEGAAGLAELRAMDALFTALGHPPGAFVFDPGIVRGLEYYTGVVFEAELNIQVQDEKGRPVQFGAVGGGGRYDDLMTRFTGQPVPATGFSFGVSRLVSALQAAGQTIEAPAPLVMVLVLDAEHTDHSFLLAERVRQAGISTEVYVGTSGMKAQMKHADRRNAFAAVIVGEDERQDSTVTIKNLELGRQLAQRIDSREKWAEERPGQVTVPADDMVKTLQEMWDGNQA